MSGNICRLCFEKKTRPIAIFTGKGIKLNIAQIIRTHFPDEVNENDELLPKFVCLYCWTKLSNFHEFYIAVDIAKNIFLGNDVKTEAPNFIEVECDPIDFEDNRVKVESDDNDKVESIPWVNSTGATDGSQDYEKIDERLFAECVDGNAALTANVSVKTAFDPSVATKKVTTKKVTAKSNDTDIENLIAEYIEMSCEICQHPFKTLKKARGHLRGVHKLRSVKVKCCQKKIDLYDINGHIQSHLNPEIFKCDNCGKTFYLKSALRVHRLNHMPKRFECDICQKKFLLLPGLKNHIMIAHVGGKRYECDICGKRLAWKMSLLTHVRIVHGQQNQRICHICAKVYKSPASLRHHLKEHSGIEQPRVTCEKCGRSCRNEITLRQHLTIHEDEGKPFPCTECTKVYSHRMALAAHIRGTHKFKLLKCHLCEKEFKRPITLKEHIATHTGAFLYNCNYCPKKFKRTSLLYPHYKKYHPVEWSADRYKSTRK